MFVNHISLGFAYDIICIGMSERVWTQWQVTTTLLRIEIQRHEAKFSFIRWFRSNLLHLSWGGGVSTRQ